jgi:hypothetical protein
MTTIRSLTTKGKAKFADYLNNIRITGDTANPLIHEFDYPPWSTEFIPTIQIEDIKFSNRMELGKYLNEKFEANGISRNELISNQGLWSWLALILFNHICPIIDNKRRLRENARYICSSDWRDYYRHLIATSWLLFDIHKEKARIFLDSKLYINNDFIEHIVDNQDIITNKPLIQAVDLLYWDPIMNKAKPYAINRNVNGNIRRFVSVVHQLALTYDLQSMEPKQIISLLGKEFQQWQRIK